jgi:hypothetical protein
MTIYFIPSIVSQSLSNKITPKNIKYAFLVTGLWQVNTDMFNDEDSSPSAVTDRPLIDRKILDNFGSNLNF